MDSALLHKLMGAMMLQGGDVELPYVEIDYCKSDGRQYVIIDFLPTDNCTYKIGILNWKSQFNTSLFGSEFSTSSGYSGVLYSSGNSVYIGNSLNLFSFDLIDGNNYNLEMYINNNNVSAIRNGTEIINKSYTGTCLNNTPIAVFGNNDKTQGKVTQLTSQKISYFESKSESQHIKLIAVRMIKDAGGGKIGDIGYWDKVNNTFHGSGSGVPLIVGPDKTQPIMDGLVHWWDSEGQSGNAWNPKVGNVPITTSDSWEDGFFKKVRGNTCETPYFDVDFSNGFTVEVLYNLPKFNDIPLSLNYDTQLWVMQNQSNQEYLLHYTWNAGDNVYSLYSPILLGTAHYGTQAPPLKQFFSDVVVYNGSDNIKGYIDGVEVLNDTALNNKPTQIKFALNRIYPLNNNLEASVKSIRIYNRALTQEEVEHNREYDKFVLGE